MQIQAHWFASSDQAYNASQSRDHIKDGDVLYVPAEGVSGVLWKAWPMAVTESRGVFHAFKPGESWSEAEANWVRDCGGEPTDYGRSVEIAGLVIRGEYGCRWYATCANDGVVDVDHPVLGRVPVCETCAPIAGVRLRTDEYWPAGWSHV